MTFVKLGTRQPRGSHMGINVSIAKPNKGKRVMCISIGPEVQATLGAKVKTRLIVELGTLADAGLLRLTPSLDSGYVLQAGFKRGPTLHINAGLGAVMDGHEIPPVRALACSEWKAQPDGSIIATLPGAITRALGLAKDGR